MTDDPNHPDPFADGLGARLQDAAAHVDGDGVTRAGVDALVSGRHRRPTARVVVGIAAAVALLGGLAAVAFAGDDDAQRLTVLAPTTSTVADPCDGRALLDRCDDDPSTTVAPPATTTSGPTPTVGPTSTVPVPTMPPTTAPPVTAPETTTSLAPSGPCDEPPVPAGATVLKRQAGEQPDWAIDLLLLTGPQRTSLRSAGLLTAEQDRLSGASVYAWVNQEQYDHLLDRAAELGALQSFGYAAYPDRGGSGGEIVIVEIDPNCVVAMGG